MRFITRISSARTLYFDPTGTDFMGGAAEYPISGGDNITMICSNADDSVNEDLSSSEDNWSIFSGLGLAAGH